MPQSRACHKRAQRARQQRQHQARLRRLQRERERLRQEQQRAQHALRALEQAVPELGRPEAVAADVQWRLQAQQKLLGKLVGIMFPPGLWLPQRP